MPASRTRKHPRLHAVALSRLPYAIGSIIRRAFGGREAFILERDGLPVAALVSAQEWLAYLESRFRGISVAIRRAEFATPYLRPDRRPKRPTRKRKGAKRPRKAAARKRRATSAKKRPVTNAKKRLVARAKKRSAASARQSTRAVPRRKRPRR
jgi:hypothetical protein